MKTEYSKSWNKSVQARKQRKFKANAPLNIKGKLLHANLSKDLRTKYGKRSLRLRVGDKVKVLRGSYKGEEQKVERVNVKNQKVYLEKIEISKKDGSKTTTPFNASNLQITSLEESDKKRMEKLKVKNNG